jgi:ferritin-like metal-binding protein YciE
VKDAGLISAAQRVEHYEIAGYGTARAYAELLGDKEGRSSFRRRCKKKERNQGDVPLDSATAVAMGLERQLDASALG